MNTETLDELEPVNLGDLFTEFSDTPLAELLLTIKDLREQIDHEQKVCAAKEFKLQKTEEQVALLEGRINSIMPILNGDADICIDCEAVQKPKDDE